MTGEAAELPHDLLFTMSANSSWMRRSPVSSGWKEVASSGPCRTATIRHLGYHVGVVVESDCLDDRGGAARRVADLKMPSAAAGVDLRLITATGTWLAEAEQAGLGDRDYTAMLKTILRGRDNGLSAGMRASTTGNCAQRRWPSGAERA